MAGVYDVETLAEQISYRMLTKWNTYFRAKDKQREKWEHYAANFTSWIAAQATGKPQRADKFYVTTKKPDAQLKKMTADEVKALWLGVFGIKEPAKNG